jgi:hypothetical protein
LLRCTLLLCRGSGSFEGRPRAALGKGVEFSAGEQWGDVMGDRLARLESNVEQLQSAVESLKQRIDALEAAPPAVTTLAADARAGMPAQSLPMEGSPGLAKRDPYDPIAVLSLVGRLFLVLAGGFFLRAMTEAGVLTPQVGIALAFTYGLIWLLLADRAGRLGLAPNAVVHALAAAMVVFPLLVEATTRFKVLTGAGSTLGLVILTVAMLLVAWRQRLRAMAWVTILAALPTSLVLLAKTGVIVPIAFYLIALGVATLWLGYSRGWTGICWPVALTADAVVVGLTLRALSPDHLDAYRIASILQWSLLFAYIVSVAVRTLIRGRPVALFEVVQVVAALTIALVGTGILTRATGVLPAAVGVISLAFGAACYFVAFAFVEGRQDLERNLYFYSTLALMLVLAGFTAMGREHWVATAFSMLGLIAVGMWSRTGRLYLLFHGAAYVVAASFASEALRYGAWALAASPVGPWLLPSAAMLVMLVAGALSAWLAAARPSPDGGALASVPRLVIVVVLVWVACGAVIGALAPVAAGSADRSVDLGALATLRTAVLAVAALLIAWASRRARFREWTWLVYPLLVVIGLKMVVQDFKFSRPATLFIALALYGAALILAPRLRRGGEKPRVTAGTPQAIGG